LTVSNDRFWPVSAGREWLEWPFMAGLDREIAGAQAAAPCSVCVHPGWCAELRGCQSFWGVRADSLCYACQTSSWSASVCVNTWGRVWQSIGRGRYSGYR